MPWCPNCRNEYKEGIKICADCSIDLVKELEPINNLTAIAGFQDNEQADKLVKYLTHEKIQAVKEYSEEDNGYVISVPDKVSKKAKKLFQAFYTVELESIIIDKLQEEADNPDMHDDSIEAEFNADGQPDSVDEIIDYVIDDEKNVSTSHESHKKSSVDEPDADDLDDGESEDDEILHYIKNAPSTSYVKKSDKSKDLKSTAATFLFFGAVGIIFTVLNIAGIFSIFNNLLSQIVMSSVFIGCLVIGIISYKDSKKADKEAVQEEEFTKCINEWLEANITTDAVNSFKDSDNTAEINFYAAIDGIKNAVTKHFGEIDEAYLDSIVEEYYNQKFDN